MTTSANKRSSALPEKDMSTRTKGNKRILSSSQNLDEVKVNDDTGNLNISEKEIQHAIALATEAAKKAFGWSNVANTTANSSNPLSEIIPGYIAPLSLDSSSLDKYKNPKRKMTTEIQNIASSTSMTVSNKPTFASKNFKLSKTDPATIAESSTNAGSSWFNFEATPHSSDLQSDIAVIRNRNYLDPKKFYKSSDFKRKGSQSQLVQLGTVIEGSMESVYSNRLSKKQRKQNVMEELMGEVFDSKDDYVKKKFTKMQREKSSAGKQGKRNSGQRSKKNKFRSKIKGKR